MFVCDVSIEMISIFLAVSCLVRGENITFLFLGDVRNKVLVAQIQNKQISKLENCIFNTLRIAEHMLSDESRDGCTP